MSRTVRRAVIALACALALASAAAAAPWGIPGGPRTARAETWASGKTMYASDAYGFTVTFSNAWTVAGIGRDGAPDYVHLTNGISAVYLGAGAWSSNAVTCVDEVMQTLRGSGFPDLEYVGELVYDDDEFAVDLVAGSRGETSVIVDCISAYRNSSFVFVWVVPGSESGRQVGLIEDLWAGVTL